MSHLRDHVIKTRRSQTRLGALSGLLIFILGSAQCALLAAVEPGETHWDIMAKHIVSSEPTWEAMDERIAGSPELSELAASFSAQALDWQKGLWCQLMQSDNPQVRVLGAEAVYLPLDGECAIDDEPLSPAEVWEQAIGADTDEPALLLKRYRHERSASNEAFWCKNDALSQQLLALEPDNAYFHLLPVTRRFGRDDAMPCDGREWILAAAGAEDFNMHASNGQYPAYLEISAYVRDHPPPLPAKPLREAWDEFGLNPEAADPAIEPSLSLVIIQQSKMSTGFLPVIDRCRQALSESDEILTEACLALAGTMTESGRTGETYTTGHWLRREMLYPVSGEAERAGDPNRWQRERDAMILVCQISSLATDWDMFDEMSPDDYRTFIQDYTNLGEMAAYRNFAARTYASDPGLFALDPGRCEDIRRLDEAQQQKLVSLWQRDSDDPNPRGWLAVQAAAEMLDTQGATP